MATPGPGLALGLFEVDCGIRATPGITAHMRNGHGRASRGGGVEVLGGQRAREPAQRSALANADLPAEGKPKGAATFNACCTAQ